MRRHLVLVVPLVGALLAGCTDEGPQGRPAPRPTVSLRLPPAPVGGFDPPVTVLFDGAPPLEAAVARRPDQRSRGLMQRTELPPGHGMIFLFPGRTSGSFYMLGTLIPLSIAYVDGDRVVSTSEMTPCPGQSCPLYPPAAPYTLAVEARAGFFPEHGVGPGTQVRIEGSHAPAE